MIRQAPIWRAWTTSPTALASRPAAAGLAGLPPSIGSQAAARLGTLACDPSWRRAVWSLDELTTGGSRRSAVSVYVRQKMDRGRGPAGDDLIDILWMAGSARATDQASVVVGPLRLPRSHPCSGRPTRRVAC